MITFYIQRDAEDGQLYVIRAEGGRHETASGPWRTNEVAWGQAENAAHRAEQAGKGIAIYTVTPDDVQRELVQRGESGSRAAWVVE